jgi:YVTN family beta-propeller protein
MKFILKLTLFLSAALVLFQGCYRDEIIINTNPSNLPNKLGVYVLSEGNGLPNQSKLSFFSFANGDFNLNITFPSVLGLYPDGLIQYNGNSMYITERGSPGGTGTIYRIDTNGIISGSNNFGINPYSLAAANGKAYCTNGPDSSVSVLDLSTLAEIKRIKVGLYPQEITTIGNKVFVINTQITGGGIDSTISVIDVINDVNIAQVRVSTSLTSVAVSNDGYLLVGSSARGGMLYKLSPVNYAKVDSFSVNSTTITDMNVDNTSDNLYFIRDHNSIVRLNLSDRSITAVVTPSASNGIAYINGYAYDVKTQKHYIADARDFFSNGFLYKFNSTGQLELAFQTGIRPRRILIRN